jgi:hypothetical protein
LDSGTDGVATEDRSAGGEVRSIVAALTWTERIVGDESFVRRGEWLYRGEQKLCNHVLFGNRCRWRGKCVHSHDVPQEILEECKALAVAKREQSSVQAHRDQRRALSVGAPPWLEPLRAECIFEWSDKQVGMRQAIEALLQLAPSDTLETLHCRAELSEAPPLCPSLIHAFKLAGRKLPVKWRDALKPRAMRKVIGKMVASTEFAALKAAYLTFIEQFLLPFFEQYGGVAFQMPPTLRVHMPGRVGTIPMHRDLDYAGHSHSEINFWIPLTAVWGSNTLHLESAPDRGDFRPMALMYGQLLRFNGNECRHYTVANTTGATRVSFDLRCIPLSLFDPHQMLIGDYKVEIMRCHPSQIRAAAGHTTAEAPTIA